MTETLRQMERVQASELKSDATAAKAEAALYETELHAPAVKQAAEAQLAVEASTALVGGTREAVAMSSGLRRAFGVDAANCEAERTRRASRFVVAQAAVGVRTMGTVAAKLNCDKQQQPALVAVEHRTQNETVERFLARSRWSSAKIRLRSLSQAA